MSDAEEVPKVEESTKQDDIELKEVNSTKNQFVILMETNGDELESWYYFIKLNGNEDVLKHLDKQLNEIEMYIEDDMSTFDLDLEHPVSEETARDMIRVELNSVTFHRKFNGKMKQVFLGMRKKDSNDRRLKKLNDILGNQQIENFCEDEEIDPENVLSESDAESNHSDDEDLIEPLKL